MQIGNTNIFHGFLNDLLIQQMFFNIIYRFIQLL